MKPGLGQTGLKHDSPSAAGRYFGPGMCRGKACEALFSLAPLYGKSSGGANDTTLTSSPKIEALREAIKAKENAPKPSPRMNGYRMEFKTSDLPLGFRAYRTYDVPEHGWKIDADQGYGHGSISRIGNTTAPTITESV